MNHHVRHSSLKLAVKAIDTCIHFADVNYHYHAEIPVEDGLGNLQYIGIHFRTGMLGQGSRTALPIFGDFMQQVLSDERFSRYRHKFAQPKGLDPSLWSCEGYFAQPADSLEADTSTVDTLGLPRVQERHAAVDTLEQLPTEPSLPE